MCQGTEWMLVVHVRPSRHCLQQNFAATPLNDAVQGHPRAEHMGPVYRIDDVIHSVMSMGTGCLLLWQALPLRQRLQQ